MIAPCGHAAIHPTAKSGGLPQMKDKRLHVEALAQLQEMAQCNTSWQLAMIRLNYETANAVRKASKAAWEMT